MRRSRQVDGFATSDQVHAQVEQPRSSVSVGKKCTRLLRIASVWPRSVMGELRRAAIAVPAAACEMMRPSLLLDVRLLADGSKDSFL
jgi:hypothetical protein